ncbi:hypothetical protein LUZ60_009737 [Juncus effusus]|nr:hypothetical protein LUZ60_009737 [Juncus effusus]
MSGSNNEVPIVSKFFCSSSPQSMLVRKRPAVVNGGGFVVTDINQKVVFVVDGCGKLGAKGELLVKDGNGESILYIHKKKGLVQALSTRNRWNGYSMDYQGKDKLLFTITDPKPCFSKQGTIRVNIESKNQFNGPWDYAINGSFSDKIFSIVDYNQTIRAQVKELTGSNKDFYHVMVQPGFDQAFVIGVIAVLDNIFGESTRC